MDSVPLQIQVRVSNPALLRFSPDLTQFDLLTGAPVWHTNNEPGGLSIAAGRLYVADTNNHVVHVVDLATRQVSTLVVMDPRRLLASRSP